MRHLLRLPWIKMWHIRLTLIDNPMGVFQSNTRFIAIKIQEVWLALGWLFRLWSMALLSVFVLISLDESIRSCKETSFSSISGTTSSFDGENRSFSRKLLSYVIDACYREGNDTQLEIWSPMESTNFLLAKLESIRRWVSLQPRKEQWSTFPDDPMSEFQFGLSH